MATKLSEVAKSFDSLAERIEKNWTPHYPQGQALKKTIGYNAPILAPQDAMNMANSIASRILALAAGKKPSEVDADDYWVEFSSQANQIDFANLTSDPVNVTRSTFEFFVVRILRASCTSC